VIRPATPRQTTAFVLVSLVPGATVQAATFGDGALANVAIAAMAAVAAETSVAKLRGIAPVDILRDGSGLVTAALIALALPPAVPVGIVIEPDGTWAFVAYTADSTVAIYDLQTLEVVNKIAAGKQALPRPKWKPRRACICTQ